MLFAEQGESKIVEVLLILRTKPLRSKAANLHKAHGPLQVYFACIRYVAVLSIVLAALFLVSFSGSAQAHGLHSANLSQSIERSSTADASIFEDSLERDTDDSGSICGANCCSMSGCGYVGQIVAEFRFPAISNSKRHSLKTLPWVRNALGSLKRPPRA